jgi:hypothetical protein
MDKSIDVYLKRFTAPPDTICTPFAEDVAELAPKDLVRAVNKIDFLCRETKSWIPAGISLWAYILHEENNGKIHSDMNVLELGSGSGSGAMIWSYMGYPITGIEIDEKLAGYSIIALHEEKNLQKAPIRIIEGSYYPEKFIRYMSKSRNKLVTKIEYEELNHWEPDHLFDTHFPQCDEDVYKKNNISLKDFDIWYAYLWSYQFPSVLDMFRQYARDDALFLAIGPDRDKIAHTLGFKTEYHSNVIRK